MSVYGNFITESQVNPVNKVKESLCEIESVVYNEYCNYKSLLESCTDDNERAVLEAKVEVLQEVSFKDIIGKIKELWAKFKQWVKDLFNKIFRNKDKIQKENKEAITKAEQSLNKAKSKGITESVYLESEDEESTRKPSMDVDYLRYANTSNDNTIGDLSRMNRYLESIEDSIRLIQNKPDCLKKSLSKNDKEEIKATFVDLISGNDDELKKNFDNISRIFLSSDNYGRKCYKYCSSFSELIKTIKEFSRDCEEDIRTYDRYINEINSTISKLSSETTPPSNEDDVVVVQMYAKVTQSSINDLKHLLSLINENYNRLLSLQNKYTNQLSITSAYLDNMVEKSLKE